MTALVTTCQKYQHLLPGFHHLWKKYVGLSIREVHMPPEQTWCVALSEVVTEIKTELVLLVLEDYWFCSPMDFRRFSKLLSAISKDKSIQKADLQRQVAHWPHAEEADGLLVANQNAPYRTSTQVAIWRKSYLLEKLRCGDSAWDFELHPGALQDGARIVGLSTATMDYANVMLKGQADVSQFHRISDWDWKDLAEKNYLPQCFLEGRSAALDGCKS
jgi:hypothetical protein